MKSFNALLFAGGTYFFVFIAGFLFQYLSDNFNVKTYFKKKFINVFCPFIITLLPVALLYTYQNADNWALQHASTGMRLFGVLIGGYIVNGPVWFIGMISIVFLFSPLFLYSRKNKKIHIILLISTLILSFIIPRTSSVNMFVGFNPYESSILNILIMNICYYFKCFFHFTFFYLLGMEICELIKNYHEKIYSNLKSIFQVSLFLYVFHFIVHLFIVKTSTNMQLISKLIETFVLLSGLMLLESKIRQNKIIDKLLKFIAKYSFGIFFIHGYIINYIYVHTLYTQRNITAFAEISHNTIKCFLTSVEMFLITLFGSLLFLWIVKTILNMIGFKKTRMIIGV